MSALKERVAVADTYSSPKASSASNLQRILVVDDENSISDLIATSLRFVGFDVRTAATGSEALSLIHI